MSHTLTIYRGPSGSGKTTAAAARSQRKGIPHFEADQFFMKDGVYQFNPSRLHAAHAWCFESTMSALLKDGSAIVSNTFTRIWEVERYILGALEAAVVDEVMIYEMTGRFSNVHGLTDAQVETQRRRFQSNTELYAHLKRTTNYGCEDGAFGLRVQRFRPTRIYSGDF